MLRLLKKPSTGTFFLTNYLLVCVQALSFLLHLPEGSRIFSLQTERNQKSYKPQKDELLNKAMPHKIQYIE